MTALGGFKRDGRLPVSVQHRRWRWLNSQVEQDLRPIERGTRPMLRFNRHATSRRASAGV